MEKQSQQTTKTINTHMNFIHSLYEARMTRDTRNQKVLTYTDCCERTYLSLLVLELLTKYARHRSSASAYAKRTVGSTNYDTFKMSSTDL